MNGRCKATDYHHGEKVRCEDIEGHRSVHYCGDHWWRNDRRMRDGCAFLLLFALAGAGVMCAFLWFITL